MASRRRFYNRGAAQECIGSCCRRSMGRQSRRWFLWGISEWDRTIGISGICCLLGFAIRGGNGSLRMHTNRFEHRELSSWPWETLKAYKRLPEADSWIQTRKRLQFDVTRSKFQQDDRLAVSGQNIRAEKTFWSICRQMRRSRRVGVKVGLATNRRPTA